IGAVVFSVFGYLYIVTRGKGRVVSSFIPKLKTKEEVELAQSMLKEHQAEIERKKEKKAEKAKKKRKK
ncbi:MAG TPA: hypothetical protein H9900_06700, partial [Candidatus Monoglobus merdigallinarum]|nr:hypothetical protein [Candidatus Monoglobus merdigallinarum]